MVKYKGMLFSISTQDVKVFLALINGSETETTVVGIAYLWELCNKGLVFDRIEVFLVK